MTYPWFHRIHIWLGWLVGVPLILWTLSGLVMVARPIEAVRGEHLRIEQSADPLPNGNPAPVLNDIDVAPDVLEIRTRMLSGQPTTLVTRTDGTIARHDAATGGLLGPVSAAEARKIVAARIAGAGAIDSLVRFGSDEAPRDYGGERPVWQAQMAEGANIYIDAESGELLAVRTPYWRLFDFMWGIHIMDLGEREDTSHPVLILFTALALVSLLLAFPMLIWRQWRIDRVRANK